MRQLSEQERQALGKAMRQAYETICDYSDNRFEMKFEAGFIAGLECQDKRIEALEAFIAGKITQAELEQVTK